jgi:hypothetical protein
MVDRADKVAFQYAEDCDAKATKGFIAFITLMLFV